MDPKEYQVKVNDLLDDGYTLSRKIHALMDELAEGYDGDHANTHEWRDLHIMSKSISGVNDRLYDTLYPRPSALTDAGQA